MNTLLRGFVPLYRRGWSFTGLFNIIMVCFDGNRTQHELHECYNLARLALDPMFCIGAAIREYRRNALVFDPGATCISLKPETDKMEHIAIPHCSPPGYDSSTRHGLN